MRADGPSGFVRHARQVVRTNGVAGLAYKVLDASGLYRRLEVVDVPTSPSLPRPYGGPHRVSVRRLADTPDDLACYARLRPDAATTRLRARLDRGEACFFTLLDDAPVSSCWGACGRTYVEYLDCELEVGPGAGYSYDSYTAPAHRGADLVSWCNDALRRWLAERGCRRIYGLQLPENASAMARAARRQYTVLGTAHVIRLGALRRVLLAPAQRGALPESFILRPSRGR